MNWRALRAIGFVVLAVSPLWSACATQTDPLGPRGKADGSPPVQGGTGGQPADVATSGSGGAASGNGGSAPSPSGGTELGGAGDAAAGSPAAAAGAQTDGGAGGAPSGCSSAADCDDHNPCTTDACQFESCSHTINEGPCADDADPCTDDVCSLTLCTHPDNQTCECKANADCDDQNVCTDDTCDANVCKHGANAAPCADDGSSCTADVCAAKSCTHPSNHSCECMVATDCDDMDACTSNQCSAAGKCQYPDNGTCPVGTPFTVDNFNSSVDWLAGMTTPDLRAVVATGFGLTNLEGNADLYVAGAVDASLEFNLAAMTGLKKLRISIRSEQAGTANLIQVGVWNGTAWSEQPLASYGAVPNAGTYAVIDVPLADFGVASSSMTKLRLRFQPGGVQKVWRLDEILAAN